MIRIKNMMKHNRECSFGLYFQKWYINNIHLMMNHMRLKALFSNEVTDGKRYYALSNVRRYYAPSNGKRYYIPVLQRSHYVLFCNLLYWYLHLHWGRFEEYYKDIFITKMARTQNGLDFTNPYIHPFSNNKQNNIAKYCLYGSNCTNMKTTLSKLCFFFLQRMYNMMLMFEFNQLLLLIMPFWIIYLVVIKYYQMIFIIC